MHALVMLCHGRTWICRVLAANRHDKLQSCGAGKASLSQAGVELPSDETRPSRPWHHTDVE